MTAYPLNNFEIKTYYQNEAKFNDPYSRNNLLEIKDGVYVRNLDEYELIGTHWIALYVNGNNRRASCDATYLKLNVFQRKSKTCRTQNYNNKCL